MVKKKKNEIVEDILPPLTFGFGAGGASVLGGTLDSHLPTGVTNPLTTSGTTLGKFVAPVSTISASNIVFKQMKKLEEKIK